MATEINDIIDIAFAVWKDKVTKDSIEKLNLKYKSLRETKVACARATDHSLIIEMFTLKKTLASFEESYEKLKSKAGSVSFIDNFIKDIKLQIKQISYEKNKIH